MVPTENSHFKDETMTRAAREERIAWRLPNLAGWRRSLLDLVHYHAEYPYDAGHEYEFDALVGYGTSDPDYIWPDVRLEEYDEDGYEIPREHNTSFFLWETHQTFCDRLGNRLAMKPDIYFDEEVAASLNLFTRQNTPKNVAVPDLAVLLPDHELPRNMFRPWNDCVFRLDKGDPAPELVLKYLATTTDWQLNTKLQLYAALGIIEYLVYDPGGMRAPGSPAELLGYRLEDGTYRVVKPDPNLSEPHLPAVESKVFGTHIRMDPNHVHPSSEYLNGPWFQWYDTATSRWRDRRTDEYQARHAKRHAERCATWAVGCLHVFLETTLEPQVREHVAKFWYEHGLPQDWLAKIKAVQQTPSQWPFLLLDPAEHRKEKVPATFRRPTQGSQAIEHLHTLLQVELEPKVREQIAAVWREEGPPDDWFKNIRAVQRTPLNWRALLLEPVGCRKGNTDRVPDAS